MMSTFKHLMGNYLCFPARRREVRGQPQDDVEQLLEMTCYFPSQIC